MKTIAVTIFQLKQLKEETWKNSFLNGNRTHELCDTGAALYRSTAMVLHMFQRDSVTGIFLAFRQNFGEIEIKFLHSHTKCSWNIWRGPRYQVNFCKVSKPSKSFQWFLQDTLFIYFGILKKSTDTRRLRTIWYATVHRIYWFNEKHIYELLLCASDVCYTYRLWHKTWRRNLKKKPEEIAENTKTRN